MRDQDVISRLVQLHDHIQAPAVPADEDARRGLRLVRRRRTVSVATLAAAVVLAVGVVQVSLPDGGGDLQPAPAPSLPAPSNPAERSPTDDKIIEREFRRIVARVPDWSIADSQRIFTSEPCLSGWGSGSGSGGGSFDVSTNGEPGQVWGALYSFPSATAASEAVDRLVENFAACEALTWQTVPIAQTGAVLASSADGVLWVHRSGSQIMTLEAVTADGPPPLSVQIEVADLMWSDAE